MRCPVPWILTLLLALPLTACGGGGGGGDGGGAAVVSAGSPGTFFLAASEGVVDATGEQFRSVYGRMTLGTQGLATSTTRALENRNYRDVTLSEVPYTLSPLGDLNLRAGNGAPLADGQLAEGGLAGLYMPIVQGVAPTLGALVRAHSAGSAGLLRGVYHQVFLTLASEINTPAGPVADQVVSGLRPVLFDGTGTAETGPTSHASTNGQPMAVPGGEVLPFVVSADGALQFDHRHLLGGVTPDGQLALASGVSRAILFHVDRTCQWTAFVPVSNGATDARFQGTYAFVELSRPGQTTQVLSNLGWFEADGQGGLTLRYRRVNFNGTVAPEEDSRGRHDGYIVGQNGSLAITSQSAPAFNLVGAISPDGRYVILTYANGTTASGIWVAMRVPAGAGS